MQRKQASESKKLSQSNADVHSFTTSCINAFGFTKTPYDGVSEISKAGNRLTRSIAQTVSMVKPIFESEYKRPEDNFRVIQDTNPVKKAALTDAQKRHEENVAKERKVKEELMKQHYLKLKKAVKDESEKSDILNRHKKDVNETLKIQMDMKVSLVLFSNGLFLSLTKVNGK